jgi:hypothetical protein
LLPGALPGVQWHIEHPRPGELRASGQANGVSIGLLVSAGGRPTRNSLRLIGVRGTVEVDLFHGFAVIDRGTVSRGRKIVQPFVHSGATLLAAGINLALRSVRREPAYPGLRQLIAAFYSAVRESKRPPISAEEALEVAVARDALIATPGVQASSYLGAR